MLYKHPHLKDELENASVVLQLLAMSFELVSESLGIIPVVTRILEKVSGSSGVHEDYRAIDFRDECDGKFLYEKEDIDYILNEINSKWPRNDGKPTCIHHQFQGGPYHFHLQLPREINTLRREKGFPPY